ncbi:MAG: leucyl aminopeptidase [Actinomycetia bacterium]|nr:leucyl aminopeptidase [Actinomycetes bacterium]
MLRTGPTRRTQHLIETRSDSALPLTCWQEAPLTSLALTKTTASNADGVVTVLVAQSDPHFPLIAEGLVAASAEAELVAAIAALAGQGAITAPTRIPAPPTWACDVVLLAPLTNREEPEQVRRAIGAALMTLSRTTQVAVCPPDFSRESLQAVATGSLLGSYRSPRPSRDDADRREPGPTEVAVLIGAEPTAEQVALTAEAEALARSVSHARDLVNLPPNLLYPQALAEQAESLLADTAVTVSSLGPEELRAEGYGGLIGVGQGSERGPRLIQLQYRPDAKRPGSDDDASALPHIALVGKGITFDSGGLSIKPAKSMETMKSDMGGSAAVLATLQAVAELGLPIKVTGWLAAAENMPSGSAQRPGDVITIRGGKTVEVLNTDAEGRLVLADAIVRAGEDNPDAIIDVATLTGAQMVALGTRVCGVMANNNALRGELVAAAEAAGEQAWPMPLPPELRPSLDSPVADLANIGDRNGGMLSAGIFLSEFVPQDIPWAHLDIAGPAFNAGPAHGYTPKGGTGFAVATLTQFLATRAGRP